MTIKNQSAISIMFFCALLMTISFLTPPASSLTTSSGNIQTTQNTASIGSGTFTVTLSSKPTSGNTLFLTYAGSGQPSNPTISNVNQVGVTWTKAVTENSLVDVEIWYGTVGTNAGTTATITITGGATSNIGNIADICEWANIATTNPVDKTAVNTGLTDRGDTGTTAISSQSNELFVGAIATKGLADQLSATNGYVLSNGQAKNLGTYVSLAELIKISTTKETANAGTNFLSTSWAGCIATFKSEDISPTSTPTATPTPTPTTTTTTPTPTPTTTTTTPTPTPTYSPGHTPTPTLIPSTTPIHTSTPTATSEPTPTTKQTTSPTNNPNSNQPTSLTTIGYFVVLAIWTIDAAAIVITIVLLVSSRRSRK